MSEEKNLWTLEGVLNAYKTMQYFRKRPRAIKRRWIAEQRFKMALEQYKKQKGYDITQELKRMREGGR